VRDMSPFRFTAPSPEPREAVSLDEVQQQVVALTPGLSASVVGAPGSGKTATLIEFVASRLQLGLAPANILVLSPHRVAATRLRSALATRLSIVTPGPWARTPASLAFSLATEHARRQGYELPRLLTGGEHDSILAEMIEGHIEGNSGPEWPSPLLPEVRRLSTFRSELRDLFSRATDLGWNAEALAFQGRAHDRPEWVAAAQLWDEYHDVLGRFRAASFDSAEFLALATTALSDDTVMPAIQLVVIDDAQELTYGAVALVRAFARRGVSVVAFGDPDTTTTSFRGAVPNFLGRLASELELPASRVEHFVLPRIYRHGPEIRELVSSFTSFGTAEAGQQRAARSALAPSMAPTVAVVRGESLAREVSQVARHLRQAHVQGGIPWSRMAVVVRSGSLVHNVARILTVAEVPTSVQSSGSALRDFPVVADGLALLNLSLRRVPVTHELLSHLLCSPWGGLTRLDLRRVRAALRQRELASGGSRTGEELLVVSMDSSLDWVDLDFAAARRASRLVETLALVRDQSEQGASIEELLWTMWERSGLAAAWESEALGTGLVADDANRNLDAIVALFASAKRFVERFPNRYPGDFVAQILQEDVPEDSLAPRAAADTVLVAAPSALIGGEFEVVAVCGVQENTWPNLRPRGSLLKAQELGRVAQGAPPLPLEERLVSDRAEVLTDEQRMFALALSRARTQLIVSASASDDTLPSVFFNRIARRFSPGPAAHGESDRSPVPYPLSLRGLTAHLRRDLVTSVRAGGSEPVTRNQLAAALSKLALAGVSPASPESWYGLLSASTTAPLVDLSSPEARVSVSPSKLETWEKNQLAWFIDSIASSTPSPAMGIGTLVHSAMEAAAVPGAPTDAESLWETVAQRWHELTFDAEWIAATQKDRVRAMIESLASYLAHFEADGKTLMGAEDRFALDLPPARVSGAIDRIEVNRDGHVVIVDLKTGKTPPAKGDIPTHAQLSCYQLAVVEGALDTVPAEIERGGAKLVFVSHGVNGKPYREVEQAPLDDSALETLRQRIIDAARGMAGASFTGTRVIRYEQGDPHSAYSYRIHLVKAVSAE
jgi:superfamily I DNA/RNA helicase/RecB family exonuclease